MTFLKAYSHGRGSRVHRQGRVGPSLHAPRGTCHRPPELSPVTRLIPGHGLCPGHSPARGPTAAPLRRGLSQASKRLGKAAPGHLPCLPPPPPRPSPPDVSESPTPLSCTGQSARPWNACLPSASFLCQTCGALSPEPQCSGPLSSRVSPGPQGPAHGHGQQRPASFLKPTAPPREGSERRRSRRPQEPPDPAGQTPAHGAQVVRALCTTHVGPWCSHLPHQLNNPPAPPSPHPRTS